MDNLSFLLFARIGVSNVHKLRFKRNIVVSYKGRVGYER